MVYYIPPNYKKKLILQEAFEDLAYMMSMVRHGTRKNQNIIMVNKNKLIISLMSLTSACKTAGALVRLKGITRLNSV